MVDIKRSSLLTTLFFLLIGCNSATVEKGTQVVVESNETRSNDAVKVKIVADAGNDKIVEVYETVRLKGFGSTTDNTELSYIWKKGDEVLATTAIFDYTPTVVGTDILEFIVQHISGTYIGAKVTIVVTEKRKSLHDIPPLSKALIKEYLYEINRVRTQPQDCGTHGKYGATEPLKWSDKLYKSSYEHTYDLAYSGKFAHTGSGTEYDWTGTVLGRASRLSERIETYGYDWHYIGENIGAGTVIDTPRKMVQGWLESDGHCINLMNPNFKEVGMAMIRNSEGKYTHYWTQNFGTERYLPSDN